MWCAGSEALAKLSEKSREPKATGSDTQRARRRNLHTTLSCIPTHPPDAVQCQGLVYIHIQKGAYCLLLISAIILFEALSVGMVVNAFGHANELQFDTTSPKLKSSVANSPFSDLANYLTI